MTSESAVSTFHYHACAHAFSGRFTRPFDHLIDVQAASSLPVIGGHGNSRIENFQFREFVSFKKGHTHVSGAHQADDNSNNTLVTATVEGLNILTSYCQLASSPACTKNIPPASRKASSPWSAANLKTLKWPVTKGGDLDCELFENIRTFKGAQKAFEKDVRPQK